MRNKLSHCARKWYWTYGDVPINNLNILFPVLAKPVLQISSKELESGKNLSIACSVSYQAPSYNFLLNGRIIKTESSSNEMKYAVQNVTIGEFACEAVYKSGSLTSQTESFFGKGKKYSTSSTKIYNYVTSNRLITSDGHCN